MLDKLGGVYAPRPSTGPHKLRESLPLVIFLRNRLKYALTNCEVTKIVMQRLIKVDGKIRTDPNYPAGFMGECFCFVLTRFLYFVLQNVWGKKMGLFEAMIFAISKGYHSQQRPIIKQVLHFWSQIELWFYIPSVLPKKRTKISSQLMQKYKYDQV